MITLPPNLTKTRFNGYFWDIEKKELYSIKIDGILKKIKPKKLNRFCKKLNNCCKHYFYCVSNKGKRKYLSDCYLSTLKLKNSEIPVKEES